MCRISFLALFSCLFGSLVTPAFAQKYNHNSYVGKIPPDLVSNKEHWLGWHERVTLQELQGRVVWLQFNF